MTVSYQLLSDDAPRGGDENSNTNSQGKTLVCVIVCVYLSTCYKPSLMLRREPASRLCKHSLCVWLFNVETLTDHLLLSDWFREAAGALHSHAPSSPRANHTG